MFGQIKQARGFRQFLLRGFEKVRPLQAVIEAFEQLAGCSGSPQADTIQQALAGAIGENDEALLSDYVRRHHDVQRDAVETDIGGLELKDSKPSQRTRRR
jgi:hypothetical protein